MENTVLKVGMREFRSCLHQYLTASSPVAVTRHGETIGFYIPTRHHDHARKELDALKDAATQLEKLLSSHAVTEAELFSDFKMWREKQKNKDK